MEGLSKDRVYTFCTWGLSRWMDAVCGEVCGVPGLPNLRMSMGPIVGDNPYYAAIYSLSLPEYSKDRVKNADVRHLQSRRIYYMNTAFWSRVSTEDADALSRAQSQLGGQRCCDVGKR